MQITSALAQSLLSDKTYDIEFEGYLSNHAKHAIVALDKLGASDERIQEYWDQYTTLTPYHLELHKVTTPWESVIPLTDDDWDNWRGKKIHWQDMLQYLNLQETPTNNYESLVKKYAPDLLDGIAGALTHGIIHLGWGIDAQNPWMIKEGLAYLNFCHVSMAPLQYDSNNDPDALSSALRIATRWQDDDLTHTWIEPTKKKYDETFHPELVPSGFQWHLAKVLKDAHPVATNVPLWIQQKPIKGLWEEMYRFVTLVYLSTRTSPQNNGNFLILHLISSLWALENVCNLMDDEPTTRRALAHFWATGICLLGASTAGFPTPQTLQAGAAQFALNQVDEEDYDWGPTVQRGCAEQEEHNIKLVHVCKSLWERYGRWKGWSAAANSFTLTPNISPAQKSFHQK